MSEEFMIVSLSSLFQIISGQAPPSKFYNSKEIGLPFLKVNNFTDRYPIIDTWTTSSLKESKSGDVLLSVAGSVGFVNLGIDASITRSIFALRPNKKITTEYLFYLLNYHSPKIANLSTGSAQQIITSKMLADYFVEIPINIEEQIQIAKILTTLDKAISTTEQVIDKYQLINTGLLHDLLTRGIDEHGNLRSEKTHKFKDSKLGRIPVEWECKLLGSEILAIDPQPDHRTPALIQDGIPYLGINDIDENGEIDLKSCRKVGRNVLEKQSSHFQIKKGDIIFGKIGTIGQPKILPEFSGYTLSANVILIQPKSVPDFIFWSLESQYISKQISNTVHTTSQPAFGMEKIRNLWVVYPEGNERLMISNILNKQNGLIKQFKSNLTKLQSLKSGLMQDLLSGKVRVTRSINS